MEADKKYTSDLKPDDMAIYILSKRIKNMEQAISCLEEIQMELKKVADEMTTVTQSDTKRNNLKNK